MDVYVHNQYVYTISINIIQYNFLVVSVCLCVCAFPERVSLNLCILCWYLMLDSASGAAAAKRAKTLQPPQEQ